MIKECSISIRMEKNLMERFDKTIKQIKEQTSNIKLSSNTNVIGSKYLSVTINKSSVIINLIKEFCDEILGNKK